MKVFEIWDKKIELNIWEALTVWEMRKIYPFTVDVVKWQEIEMVVNVIKSLSSQVDVEDIINSLSIEEFTKLSEDIVALINQKKK